MSRVQPYKTALFSCNCLGEFLLGWSWDFRLGWYGNPVFVYYGSDLCLYRWTWLKFHNTLYVGGFSFGNPPDCLNYVLCIPYICRWLYQLIQLGRLDCLASHMRNWKQGYSCQWHEAKLIEDVLKHCLIPVYRRIYNYVSWNTIYWQIHISRFP